MELTKKQSEALDIAIKKYRAGARSVVISGYAGAGKSTVVKYIIAALCSEFNLAPELDVAYCAFTGKAASVLAQKGCPNAITAHKLMYQARPMPNGSFMFVKKMALEYRIVVVDECSMLPKTMMEILQSYPNVFVIYCGDPGQLPPVDKDQDNHLLDYPDIFLDEIMRQAKDSGIIQLSMKIRNGESIDNFTSDDALVLPKAKLVDGMYDWADIILSATNKTRIAVNNQMRQMKGYTSPIEENEKVICCSNYWGVVSAGGNALTNGCIGYLKNGFDSFQAYPPYLGGRIETYGANFISEFDDDFGNLNLDKVCLITGVPALDGKAKYKIRRVKKYQDTLPLEFTYGYCITGHRSQGSQWDKVLVIEERFPFDKEEHKKWLYTCCTRASQKCVIVR